MSVETNSPFNDLLQAQHNLVEHINKKDYDPKLTELFLCLNESIRRLIIYLESKQEKPTMDYVPKMFW
jgi:ribosomal protein S15P/S13E